MNNTQPNGLANVHDDEPWLSLWSVGSHLSPWSPQSSCIL
ncbi:DUF3131 domain-containing protein [Klebsiella variicola subsp. variicola]|nr:DUF3131 domain-containing protein [Klebsiella variicola subsp. variicola]